MRTLQIAIDGPSGSGKSTLAKAIAKRLGIIYVDTGALYRAIGLYCLRNGVDSKDAQAVIAVLPKIRLELRYTEEGQNVYLNEENVSTEIRLPQVAMYASDVSAIPAVRQFLLELQRSMGETHHVVMDGRDIGTVILPNAQLKLFLSADERVRAERRVKELAQKGETVTVEEILAQQAQRDAQDSSRAVAPLKPAEDAVRFDNSAVTVEESVEFVLSLLAERKEMERFRV